EVRQDPVRIPVSHHQPPTGPYEADEVAPRSGCETLGTEHDERPGGRELRAVQWLAKLTDGMSGAREQLGPRGDPFRSRGVRRFRRALRTGCEGTYQQPQREERAHDERRRGDPAPPRAVPDVDRSIRAGDG